MLPDFASMARARLVSVDDSEVADGIAWHHLTDRLFHQNPSVVRLMRTATMDLARAGFRRGSARGAGHVVIELLLDGYLIRDIEAQTHFAAAIRGGGAENPNGWFCWRSREEEERWRALQSRLEQQGAPTHYTRMSEVARGTSAALGNRPLLALSDRESALLVSHLPALRDDVEAEAPLLLANLRKELDQVATARWQ
jgi:hypothetical protein